MTRKSQRQLSFNSFFRTRLLPALERFERTRRRRLPFLAIVSALILGAIAAVIAVFIPYLWLISVILGFFSVVGAALGVIWRFVIPRDMFYPGSRRFAAALLPIGAMRTLFDGVALLDNLIFENGRRRNQYSAEVVAPTVDYVMPGLNRRTVEYLGQGDFLESQMFTPRITRYGGRDCFRGKFNGLDISFSWIKAGYSEGGMRDRRFRRVFNGWFFAVTFPRDFAGRTLILPDIAEAAMGWFGRSIQEFTVPPYFSLIHLEDPDFERRFKVLSTSQLDSRYVVTPRFMRTASAIHKRLNGELALSFYRNRMYAAFPAVGEHFEYPPVLKFTDPTFTRHLFHSVNGVRELSEGLLKNLKVWQEDVIQFQWV